jgi:hypothetical protein
MRINKAEYVDQVLPEYNENALISALPQKISDAEVIEKLSNYPEYNEDIREKDAFIRTEYLSRLEYLVQPFQEYLTSFRSIERNLKQSYTKRNPLSPSTASYLHYTYYDKLPTQPSTGVFNPSGRSITITGISGIGKSKMLNRILDQYPQVIEHTEFNGNELPIKQVVWLKIECSHDSTLGSICHSILTALSECTGDIYKPEKTIAKMQDQIDHLLRSNFVGLLLIDEMQNLKLAKAGGEKIVLNFILRLINLSGILTIFCGNPELKEILTKEFRNARRAESGGCIDVMPLSGELWDLFVEELWYLQWTSIETPLTKELSNKLFELSKGNIDVSIRIYEQVQLELIGSGDERITTESLIDAYNKACQLTKAASQNTGDPESFNLLKRREKTKRENKNKINQSLANKSDNNSLNHCPHPEFEDSISRLIYSPIISNQIEDPDYIQRKFLPNDSDIGESDSIILNDPLNRYHKHMV